MKTLFGLIVLILDIYAIVQVLKSGAKPVEKLLWILVILILPLLGLIIWFFAGPGRK
ncbi:PLDc N-terminal domain-containing protein [Gallaecimonas kandeliae]|uniref:PLDc N-terminal domain-containing protein n=1 Tax=Gallaecimonas kandeliae TaxID=3029055 RepID=UPI002648266E|nr:PLDc N-terminal domain-containing protein [Gallaecimonas kandeliae]WKE65221.1 PLDc N-terminal domain-containing protein [Gallaecimonas kandeliae]